MKYKEVAKVWSKLQTGGDATNTEEVFVPLCDLTRDTNAKGIFRTECLSAHFLIREAKRVTGGFWSLKVDFALSCVYHLHCDVVALANCCVSEASMCRLTPGECVEPCVSLPLCQAGPIHHGVIKEPFAARGGSWLKCSRVALGQLCALREACGNPYPKSLWPNWPS